MIVDKLILKHYNRLMLSDINYFEITFTDIMQLILGRNGSGKSSVLAELTPYPPHHSDFPKSGGGEKHFYCHNDHHQYVLTAAFNGGSGHHEFWCDGENLNPGRTRPVQIELVETHFGLTREITDILLGVTTFTGMSTAKRREWLTRLSPTDLHYAFDLYQKLKTAQRDRQGVVKHFSQRLAKEHQNSPDQQQLEVSRQQKAQHEQQLDQLYQHKQANTPVPDTTIEASLESLTKKLKGLLGASPYHIPGLAIKSPEDLSEAIQSIYDRITRNQALLDQATEEYQHSKQNAPSLDDQLTVEQIEQLRQERNDQHAKVDSLTASQVPYEGPLPLISLEGDPQPRVTNQRLHNEIQNLLEHFPENPDGYYNTADGRATKERYDQTVAQQQHLEQEIVRLSARRAQLKGCESIACPNCDHRWVPGVDPHEITHLEKTIREHQAQLDPLPTQLEKDHEYLEALRDYTSYVRQFRHLTQQWPAYDAVWTYCAEHKVFFRHPKHWVETFQVWFEALDTRLYLAEQANHLRGLNQRLQVVDAVDRDGMAQHQQHLNQLQQKIEAYTAEARDLQQERDALLEHQRVLNAWITQATQAFEQYHRLIEAFKTDRRYAFQQLLNDETQRIQLQLAQVQEHLSRAEVHHGVITDIEEQHAKAEQEFADYKALTKAMAPTDGLIGQYLMTFMHTVVGYLNAIINKVWTYPLEVLPSRIEKDGLDYKFPLWVNDGAVSPGDIALGSTSQRDIVNFAFRMLVVRFLGLQDIPLYLDELGNTFDEQHRINVVGMIDSLIELGQVRQVFFISHYASTYGAFTQPEVCVVDSANVQTPKAYNQHVVMA